MCSQRVDRNIQHVIKMCPLLTEIMYAEGSYPQGHYLDDVPNRSEPHTNHVYEKIAVPMYLCSRYARAARESHALRGNVDATIRYRLIR